MSPGGVQSPVRAFHGVGGTPPFIVRGERARITDADGNEYLDYVCSWGPLILGHAAPEVTAAIRDAAILGTSYGAPTPSEVELARLVTKAVPSLEMVRFVSSGTEATMSAVRLARAYTGREKILKFEGCYHGHGDAFLVKAGSGLATLGIPASPGVPRALAELTLNAPYNDLKAAQGLVRKHAQDLAAIIVEPVAGNMGVVPPGPGFLQGLREITRKHKVLLIFDEVITGFRVGLGGAQKKYGVLPDLTTLGKIIGGGLPVGAYGGKREIMDMVAPSGPVYQAGTLSGNPLAMAAGIATLKALGKQGVYQTLEKLGLRLEQGLLKAAKNAGIPVVINRVGSCLTLFFTDKPVRDYASAMRSDTRRYSRFFQAMLSKGIYLPPSQFEAWFLSLAHTQEDVALTLAAAQASFRKLA